MGETQIDSVVDAMTALGEAWRGDWSDFDGRSLRSQLDELADLFRKANAGDDVTRELAGFYAINELCQQHRCWREHCRDEHV